MTEERIRKRITELKAQRDKLVQEANQQIAAHNGAIGELEALLEPEKAEPKPKEGECA